MYGLREMMKPLQVYPRNADSVMFAVAFGVRASPLFMSLLLILQTVSFMVFNISGVDLDLTQALSDTRPSP
jgi:hypothetical protein